MISNPILYFEKTLWFEREGFETLEPRTQIRIGRWYKAHEYWRDNNSASAKRIARLLAKIAESEA